MSYCGGILPEKTLLILVFGILVWLYPPSCWCLCIRALDLRGMQASQISTFMYGNVPLSADLAINGDLRTFPRYFSCSITGESSHPWWKVDLGTNHLLGRITLVNRGDCCPYRLAGATVRAGIDSNIFQNAACGLPVTSDQASIFGAHIQFVCDPPVTARYVSVDDKLHHRYASAHDNTITLCEVIVEEYLMEDCLQTTTLDLRGMQASQISSIMQDGVQLTADLATNGDLRTSPQFFSCSITGESSHPWWKVDLGTNHCLGRITLVNRGDCCPYRLAGATVRAGNDSDLFENAACGLPVTTEQASIPGAHIQFVCDPPVAARYVSVDDKLHHWIAASHDNTVTLCEVIVEAYPSEDCLQTTTLDLKGMQASQISDVVHLGVALTADLAIDGDTRTNADLFSCSITGASSHPWWKVDLGANHCLGRITLVNRGDCCQDQLYGAIVRAGTDSDISNNAACGLPVTLDQTSVLVAHITAVCVPALTARYVSVDNPRDAVKPLALCEVMVEEFPMEDCPQTTTIRMSATAIIVDPPFSITSMATLIFEGKRVTSQRPLLVVNTKSPMQCFLSCKMNNECRSFDYVMASGQCGLYDVKAGDLMADDQPGCLVYAIVRG